MKKIYPFYIATTSCLFLALFAVFALAGLGGAPQPLEAPPTPTPPPLLETAQLDYPDLKAGVMYSVSHRTAISADPEGIIDRKEELPPGGIFFLEGREKSGGDLWYRITVNSGFDDYPMYLKAEDLNWKTVQPALAPEMQAVLEHEELLAQIREVFGTARREVAPPPPPEPEPTTTERMTAILRDSLTSISSQGLLTAALAAAVTAFAIICTIGILVWLYTTRRWHKSSLFDELESEPGEESYEDTE